MRCSIPPGLCARYYSTLPAGTADIPYRKSGRSGEKNGSITCTESLDAGLRSLSSQRSSQVHSLNVVRARRWEALGPPRSGDKWGTESATALGRRHYQLYEDATLIVPPHIFKLGPSSARPALSSSPCPANCSTVRHVLVCHNCLKPSCLASTPATEPSTSPVHQRSISHTRLSSLPSTHFPFSSANSVRVISPPW